MGVEQIDQARDLVTQGQTPFLQAPQQQFVLRDDVAQPVDGGIEVGVFDPQLDQLAGK